MMPLRHQSTLPLVLVFLTLAASGWFGRRAEAAPPFADVPCAAFHVTLTGNEAGLPVAVRMTVHLRGAKARIDLLGDYDDFKKGDYLLTDDGGATFRHVSIRERVVHAIDAASLRRDVESQQQGASLSVGMPATVVTHPAPDRECWRRTYRMKAKRFFFSAAIQVVDSLNFHRMTAPSNSVTPSFNPVLNLLFLEYSAPLFKRTGYATGDLIATLPKGWIDEATLETHLNGAYREDDAVQMRCAPPTVEAVPDPFFDAPTGWSLR